MQIMIIIFSKALKQEHDYALINSFCCANCKAAGWFIAGDKIFDILNYFFSLHIWE